LGFWYYYADCYVVGDIRDKLPIVYGSESSLSAAVHYPSEGATTRWSQHYAAVDEENGLIFYTARVLSDTG
jgi:hypothetical protein